MKCTRILDIIISSIVCIALIPITLVIMIAKWVLGEKNKVFYVSRRIGKNGKVFNMIKYRTMVDNAEKILQEYMKNDINIRNEYSVYNKLENDPRVTKIGNVLRMLSIDELPQFINVLKGDMSIIGPRPYLVKERNQMGTAYYEIIKTVPGVSGIWQVQSNRTTFNERLYIESNYYNEKISVKEYFKIIFKTIMKITGLNNFRNIYRETMDNNIQVTEDERMKRVS